MNRDANDDSRFMALTSLPWWPVLAAPWLSFAVLAVWRGWHYALAGAVLLEGLALICASLLDVRATRRKRLPERPQTSSAAGRPGLPLANRG